MGAVAYYEVGRLAVGEHVLLNPLTQSKMLSTLHDLRFRKSKVEFYGMVDASVVVEIYGGLLL